MPTALRSTRTSGSSLHTIAERSFIDEPELAKKAHCQEGSYLDIFSDEAMSGFNPSDYQIQLTRRVRGLPLWFSLAMHGTERYEQAIERGIELAQHCGKADRRRELYRARPRTESLLRAVPAEAGGSLKITVTGLTIITSPDSHSSPRRNAAHLSVPRRLPDFASSIPTRRKRILPVFCDTMA